ncbi:MAG: ACT domain-containing protein [Planctomycetota bacterium]
METRRFDSRDNSSKRLCDVPDRPGIAAEIFEAIGRRGIIIDMIVQGIDGTDGSTSLSFTVNESSLAEAAKIVNESADAENPNVESADGIAKLTVSGIGLRSHTQVGEMLFGCLAESKINVEMINTSELQVNAVVDGDKAQDAMDSLRETFADSLGSV